MHGQPGVARKGPMPITDASLITNQSEFDELCRVLRGASRIAFDTEFIPERTYTPELCLVQVATDEIVAAFDPIALPDVTPFWHALVEADAEVVVHAGKHEMDFCVAATQKLPSRLVDVQLAAGFVGLGHPISYTNLISRVLNVNVHSAETRTDWSHRPLSARQIQYALDDVRYLIPVWGQVASLLDAKGRRQWYEDELRLEFASHLEDPALRSRRVSGAGGLKPRALAVMREIVAWREERARTLNRPPRWILRDDIIAELAKRQPVTLEELKSTRGLGIDGKAQWAKELIAAIQRGIDIPDDDLPRSTGRRETTEEQMVAKILAAAMLQRGSEQGIATGVIGSNEDLRDLLDWFRADGKIEKPSLLLGWREELIGRYLLQILSGEVVARVAATADEIKLHFEPATQHPPRA